MRGMLIIALLFALLPRADSAQTLSLLHIRITLTDPEQGERPVPRHTLLISDNPSTAAPRLVMTGSDGTADVRLRPGNYTVESDKPAVFHGKAYEWTQIVDIVAGRDGTLELTAANADVTPARPGNTPSTALESDPWLVIPEWEDSVVALWTPYTRASGFVIDARGLIATSQRAIGAATSVEVQLTQAIKLEGRVLASDPAQGVAVVWIDPKAIPSVRPVPLACNEPAKPPLAVGQEIFTIGVPMREPKDMTSGTISGIEPGAVLSNVRLEDGGAGGPVFIAPGSFVGITSVADGERGDRGVVRILPASDACAVVSAAEKKMQGTPPSGTRLPVEPSRSISIDALKEAVEHRGGSLNAYQISSSGFDIAFITPVHVYGTRYRPQPTATGRGKGARAPDPQPNIAGPLTDFGTWSRYVEDLLPVLLVRVTPKLVEGFWTTVARGAARTQGVSVPPIKRPKAGFSRLRAFCANAEVTPIHPFKIARRLSENTSIDEGLYVFDPGALGPDCGTVKLVLYSVKEPDKADTRVIDPGVVQQIWQDFAQSRAQSH